MRDVQTKINPGLSWQKQDSTRNRFLISNFRRVLNVVCFLLGNSPASEFYIPTFRNTICSIVIGR